MRGQLINIFHKGDRILMDDLYYPICLSQDKFVECSMRFIEGRMSSNDYEVWNIVFNTIQGGLYKPLLIGSRNYFYIRPLLFDEAGKTCS